MLLKLPKFSINLQTREVFILAGYFPFMHLLNWFSYSCFVLLFSTSSSDPSGRVQLLPGHAVAAGARCAVRRCGFLRSRDGEGAGVGACRCALRCQFLLQTAAPGAQDQVGERVACSQIEESSSPAGAQLRLQHVLRATVIRCCAMFCL